MNYRGLFIILILVLTRLIPLNAQQNHLLFLAHDITESNLLNPAVTQSCEWYLGIPVLSSVHANIVNSSFTFNQMFSKTAPGVYSPNLESIVDRLHFRNFTGAEAHIQLFALGYKKKQYNFMFTVTEKNNTPVTYPKDLALLILQGNSPFIGETASLKGTGVYYNHYREYGFGVSKKIYNGFYVGVKAKLLFGKLNLSTRKTNIDLTTDATTFDLNFEGEALINSSLPIVVDASNNQLNSIAFNEAISPIELALNRKNPGFAFDFGIIYPLAENLQLSASVLDLGLIRWRSNLNTFDASGAFTYGGPVGSTLPIDAYFDQLADAFMSQMSFEVYQDKYTTILPPRISAGLNYQWFKWLNLGVMTDAIIYKTKTMPSITFTGQVFPLNWLGLYGSYSIQNYNFNNVGAGFFIGRQPLQFYFVTDNFIPAFNPYNARMANVRFGINFNFGCPKESKSASTLGGQETCTGLEYPSKKQYLKQLIPWDKRKNKK